MAQSKVSARVVHSADFRWAWILVLAFVLVVHAPLSVDAQQSSTPEGVEAAFARLQRSIDAESRALKPMTSTDLTGLCADAKGYPTAAVHDRYESIRAEVFAAVQAPEAAALRDLLERSFPVEPTQRSTCFHSVDATDAASVNRTYSQLLDFVARARRLSRPMTVIVAADQPEALAMIRPMAGGIAPAARWTTSTFEKLFRGLYHLTVEKQGFESFDDDLGELDADKVTIACQLAPLHTNTRSICAVAR